MSDSKKKEVDTAAEREEVLNKLSMKEDALKKRVLGKDLSEDDFVQLLNLSTKKDLVEQASDYTIQEITDSLWRSNGVRGGSGPIGATAISATGGPLLAGVAVPVWLWGKGKEVVRTFKTSYQNDASKFRIGKALVRAVKYPFFKVPLLNKMRRDMNFNATSKERAALKKELLNNRVNGVKRELLSLAKHAGYGALLCSVPAVVIGGGASFATGSTLGFTDFVSTLAIGGAVIGTAIYPVTACLREASKIEPKYVKGRRLIEQALGYPAVNEFVGVQKTDEKSSAETRQKVKAQLHVDKALAKTKEGYIGQDDDTPNVFKKTRHSVAKKEARTEVKNISIAKTR